MNLCIHPDFSPALFSGKSAMRKIFSGKGAMRKSSGKEAL
jgi:hypothetical protein